MTFLIQRRQVPVRRTAWMVALLSTSVLVGACGDGNVAPSEKLGQPSALTREEYQQGIREILGSEETREASRLYTEAVATNHGREQCAQRVRGLHESLRSIVSRVEELRPPADAADAQHEFLEAAGESVRLVGAAADDVAKGDLACGRPLNARIYGMPSTERAEAAIAKPQEKGYQVFGE